MGDHHGRHRAGERLPEATLTAGAHHEEPLAGPLEQHGRGGAVDELVDHGQIRLHAARDGHGMLGLLSSSL